MRCLWIYKFWQLENGGLLDSGSDINYGCNLVGVDLGRYYKIRFDGGTDTNLPQNTDLQSVILVVSKKYQGTDYTISLVGENI